jgi:flagellar basal-body rod protein FlgG
VNVVFTNHKQGAFQSTENPLDLALQGKGFFTIQTPRGERYTRDGSFFLNQDNYAVNKEGFYLLGESGPLQLQMHNYKITDEGNIIINQANRGNLTSPEANQWEEPVLLDRLKIRDFTEKRELKKEGANNYFETLESGPPIMKEPETKVLQGFLEKSNVVVVKEMVRMIEIQRHYEANQKVIQAEDAALGKLINEVAR